MRLLIIPVLLISPVVFAQGGPGGKGNFTPPTAEQIATGQATQIARFLRLDSAATTTLVNALAGGSGPLTTEETTLTALRTQLKTDSAAVVTAIVGGGTPTTIAVDADNGKIYDTKAGAAAAVVATLKNSGLWASLSDGQKNGVVGLVLGGGPGFGGPGFGPRGRFGRPAPASGN